MSALARRLISMHRLLLFAFFRLASKPFLSRLFGGHVDAPMLDRVLRRDGIAAWINVGINVGTGASVTNKPSVCTSLRAELGGQWLRHTDFCRPVQRAHARERRAMRSSFLPLDLKIF